MAILSRDEICSEFLGAVPYTLYPFQEEALLAWFESKQGVLVTAPTGMGKTLIAEAAVFEALRDGSTMYYTTPLIALTDQKFRELQDKAEAWGYAREDVGLVTGNRKVNPDARVKVVVAEILLNHVLSKMSFENVSAVVMDEFHWFNDHDRGIVWELALVLLPKHVRLLLLSATVGNAVDFTLWLNDKHGRNLRLITTDERRVPLDFQWVEDKLLNEHLESMLGNSDATARVPALVFCFVRDECWEVADRLKGLSLIPKDSRAAIEERLQAADLRFGIGPKLQQMLIRGVGVHHAGLLPRHKELVETLFLAKLVPFVVCTETLAAGVNLPARAVVLTTLLQGKPGERKLIASSSAHQMFGRAGRPQFDKQGYVFVLAHEDDVRIARWKAKYEQLFTQSKDLGILKAMKELERKKPSRRSTEQYWNKSQLEALIKAGPQKLASRGMIPYRVLVWLLARSRDLGVVRTFLRSRFDTPERLARFDGELDRMIANLAAQGYLKRDEATDHVEIEERLFGLLEFRSIDPPYAEFLCSILSRSDILEKTAALESILEVPFKVIRAAGPHDHGKGPLQREVLEPLMIAMGIKLEPEPKAEGDTEPEKESILDHFVSDDDDPDERPPQFADMLRIAFEKDLPHAENIQVQPKWVAGGVFDAGDEFYRFVKSRGLEKNEGLVFRHLLRLVILAGEFYRRTQDPDYQDIVTRATRACRDVDPAYTERYLASESEARALLS
jgi:superfamily II DNA/RNA helicase